ncbi:MAG: carbohydrate ABC transporter permease [Chloroflexota bacterium]
MNVRSARRRAGIARSLLLALYSLVIVIPIVYMLDISLTAEDQIEFGPLVPTTLDLENYVTMWTTVHLSLYLANSLIVSIASAVLATGLALGGAYVFARFRFPGRDIFGISLIAVQTIPTIMLLLPLFIIYVILQNALHVKIIGSLAGLIVTYLTFALPFAVWLLASYLRALPAELEEAGLVDGCSRFRVIVDIVLPLALPAIVVTLIFSFLLSWNEVLFASVLTSDATRTLGIGLQGYLTTGEAGGQVYWNQLMGASLVSSIPAAVLFLGVQRFIVQGLTHGAVRG